MPSPEPTFPPTNRPTNWPTTKPTVSPTDSPTKLTTNEPTGRPTTAAPTGEIVVGVQDSSNEARFYAIGDVPYTTGEATVLEEQINKLPSDAEFLIHVGDIRSARDGRPCAIEEYHNVASILNQSHTPVFMVMGGK